MHIGIFDSGLGGFIIAMAIQKAMPEYNYAKILVTDITPNIKKLSQKWFGKNTKQEF